MLVLPVVLSGVLGVASVLAADPELERAAGAAAPDGPGVSASRQASGGPPEGRGTAALSPPTLLELAEVPYPEEAAGPREPKSVALQLLIDPSGRVSSAEIVESAGPPFDEAAVAALLRSRFAPARRGDTPIAAKILFRYDFEPPAAKPGVLAGLVHLGSSGSEPAVGAEIVVTSASRGAEYRARTDLDGRFRLEALPPDVYQVRAGGADPGGATLETTVVEGGTTEISVRLAETEATPPIEITVATASEAQALRRSARAVHVISTEDAQREGADLGEVLARSQGLGIRRSGGLGSSARVSLNGLTDDQVRFFVDGLPLDLAGYPFGVANYPVNLVQRVEVYRGVVPVRFGANALGGAINLVTDQDLHGTHGHVSYQTGSFGLHRLTLSGRHLHEPSGFLVRANTFLDHADNDYEIDVQVPDERGRPVPARVRRFHDRYRAVGGNVELGLVERRWARRLLLRVFGTAYDQQMQHNLVMSLPYGDAEFGRVSTGSTIRYDVEPAKAWRIEAVAGYAYTRTRFLDVGECVYSWLGRCGVERRQPGEIMTQARDQIVWQHGVYGRLNMSWRPRPQHELLLSLSPTHTVRTGDEQRQRDPTARDPLTAEWALFDFVTGLEYTTRLFADRLENIVFFKDYVQRARAEEPIPGGAFSSRDRNTHRVGVGDSLRYRFTDWLYAKASYEWATRLPRPDEIFGDAVLVLDNLELEPETSHNANLGLTVEASGTRAGDWRADANAFLREAENLIVLLGNELFFTYQNVYGARSVGIEGAAGWTSPGEYVTLDANVTYQDFRNTSEEGTFGGSAGDRIPNRPYLFANASGYLTFSGLAARRDELRLGYHLRYVHDFFRGWESLGVRSFKQRIDAQLLHTLLLTYLVEGDRLTVAFTGEAQNVGDAKAFDFYGVQRPGRAFSFKVSLGF